MPVENKYAQKAQGVLGHELAHILAGHCLNRSGGRWKETQADEWAGWSLARMGVPLEESLLFSAVMGENGSLSHPPRRIRRASIERGWHRGNSSSIRVPGAPRGTRHNWWQEWMRMPLPWAAIAENLTSESTSAAGHRSNYLICRLGVDRRHLRPVTRERRVRRSGMRSIAPVPARPTAPVGSVVWINPHNRGRLESHRFCYGLFASSRRFVVGPSGHRGLSANS